MYSYEKNIHNTNAFNIFQEREFIGWIIFSDRVWFRHTGKWDICIASINETIEKIKKERNEQTRQTNC